jgi:DNA-binding transcriptional MerR regulator
LTLTPREGVQLVREDLQPGDDDVIAIGAFARVGGVTVRTLRLYDELALLRPARVDPKSGYRSYRADQLTRLHRIVVLKDLGCSLSEVARVLDDRVSVDELRGMLKLRRAEAAERIRADEQRLRHIEARLALLEVSERKDNDVNTENGRTPEMHDMHDMVVRSTEAVTLATMRANVAGPGDPIGEVLPGLYAQLSEVLAARGIATTGPSYALYDDDPADAERPMIAIAAFPVAAGTRVDHPDVDIVDTPGFERAVCTIHRGAMTRIHESYDAMVRWAEAAGETIVGMSREVYLDCDGPQDQWVTELQFPLAATP